jgi:hypothetical protein
VRKLGSGGGGRMTYGFPVGAIVGLVGSTFAVSTAFASSFPEAVAIKRENKGAADLRVEGTARRAALLEPIERKEVDE